jgi:hypothetical protein
MAVPLSDYFGGDLSILIEINALRRVPEQGT